LGSPTTTCILRHLYEIWGFSVDHYEDRSYAGMWRSAAWSRFADVTGKKAYSRPPSR
jgi:hypothetical protein